MRVTGVRPGVILGRQPAAQLRVSLEPHLFPVAPVGNVGVEAVDDRLDDLLAVDLEAALLRQLGNRDDNRLHGLVEWFH